MGIVQPGYTGWLNCGKFKFHCGKFKFHFNMARNTNVILGIFGLITIQFAVFMTMVMELYSLILLWKIYEKQRNDTIVASIQRKRSYFLRKLKQARLRRLRRNKRRCWVLPGRTEQLVD
jgi:hypothetical protein